MTIDLSALTGSQTPRIANIPDGDDSRAGECLALADHLGYNLLPWESSSLALSVRLNPEHLWSALYVVILAPRQNGKTHIVEPRELYGAILLNEGDIYHTAHRSDTAFKAQARMLEHLQSQRDMERRIKKVITANGKECIRFMNGSTIWFKTRSPGSGRGLGGSPVTFDEAYNLPVDFYGDAGPVVSAQWNPQSWFLSSAVDEAKHRHGLVLARLRRQVLRALAKGEIVPEILYLEWSAEPGPDPLNPIKDMPIPLADIRNARQANPSLGTSRPPAPMLERTVKGEAASWGKREYAVERLGIGYWPEDPDEAEDDPELIAEPIVRKHVITVAQARMRTAADSLCCIAIDMSPDRAWCSVGTATSLRDGGIHVEVGRHERPSRELVRDIIRLVFRWNPCAVIMDQASNAGSMIPDLRQAGIEVETTTATQFGAACGGMYDDLVNAGPETISMTDDPLLFSAIAGSRKRDLPRGGWALARAGALDISPFVVTSLARYGLLSFGQPIRKAPIPFMPGMGSNLAVPTGAGQLIVPDGAGLTSTFSSEEFDPLTSAF